MDNKTLEALKGSIEKWEKIVDGSGVDRLNANCPLCALFINHICRGCPVRDKSKDSGCRNTPYQAWSEHQNGEHDRYTDRKVLCSTCEPLAKTELEFLKALLPEEVKFKIPNKLNAKKEGIQQNDIVAIFDGSYSIELKDKLLNPRRNICTGLTYIVLATDLKLPTRQGDGSVNDTIVQEITDRNYIFTQKQFLRLKHRCDHCPNCGDKI